MEKIKIYTVKKIISADLITSVSVYLQVRDKYRNALLLENSDYHSRQNSRSFICCEPLVTLIAEKEKYIINKSRNREQLPSGISLNEAVQNFMQGFDIDNCQALFGYTCYEANKVNRNINSLKNDNESEIPLAIYSLYKHIISIDHYTNQAEITCLSDNESEIDTMLEQLEEVIRVSSSNNYSFQVNSTEECDCTDEQFKEMVSKAKAHCKRGDVFQMVLSRCFKTSFKGDEFSLYRSLRTVNPSPYLFYFDYGNFKLFGSSPEAQLVVKNGQAEIHPIAGTYKRGPNDLEDFERIKELLADKKEGAEHVMLVDLARNDLSTGCTNVRVDVLKEPQLFSHVIHLVSKVVGNLRQGVFAYDLLSKVSPAGTLSGAPKHRAMQLIEELETSPRGFYGGAVGMIGFDNSLNHAIMIRTFMSKSNTLYYRAGAGVVDASNEQSELNEVNNKIEALRLAIKKTSKA